MLAVTERKIRLRFLMIGHQVFKQKMSSTYSLSASIVMSIIERKDKMDEMPNFVKSV